MLSSASVAAQRAEPWLIVGTGTQTDPWMQPLGESVRKALNKRAIRTWPLEQAADRFELDGSSPAPELSDTDIENWAARSRSAVRHLARADYDDARRDLREAQKLADKAAEELNREAQRARQVLDTCLFMVRALVETGDKPAARTHARQCRNMVPRVEPSEHRHTPEVRDLLQRVDRQLAAEPKGTLNVRADKKNCAVRLNGVQVGHTPLVIGDLNAGPYRLQVECPGDPRGRVHRVTVGSGTIDVRVDTRLDHAVRSEPQLMLIYDSQDTDDAYRLGDAKTIATTVPAEAVVLMTAESGSVVRLDLRSVAGVERAASTWLTTDAPAATVQQAVDALLEGNSVDFSGPAPVSRAAWQPSRKPATRATALRKPPKKRLIGGAVLLAAGVGALTAGWVLHAKRADKGDAFEADPDKQDAWLEARVPLMVVGAAGSALSIAAMPLVLPEADSTPWWAWTSGVAGLGLVGYALAEGLGAKARPAGAQTCASIGAPPAQCVDREQSLDRAALLSMTAAPLITVPLVYLLRKPKATPSLSLDRDGGRLIVTGQF